MSYKNPDYQAKYQAKYNEYLKHHAVKSISSGHIIDQHKWDLWVNAFKRSANQTNKPYSEDFTNDIIFAMMLKGCFYCGQLTGLNKKNLLCEKHDFHGLFRKYRKRIKYLENKLSTTCEEITYEK